MFVIKQGQDARLSVCSFVRLLPTCKRLRKRMNRLQCKLAQIFPGTRARTVNLGVRGLKVKVTRGQTYTWKPSRDIILDPLK